MEFNDFAISDGTIETTRSSLNQFVIVFRDWQEQQWEISFQNVIGVENFNVEGEELDRVFHDPDSDLIDRSCKLAEQVRAAVKCYAFCSPWNDEPLLRVVATGCDFKKIVGRNDST